VVDVVDQPLAVVGRGLDVWRDAAFLGSREVGPDERGFETIEERRGRFELGDVGRQQPLGDDSPPPTATLWAKYVGDEPADSYSMQGMVLHLHYGTAAGAVFVIALPAVGVELSDLLVATAAGVGYAIVLTLFAMVSWMNIVLAMDAEPEEMALFVFFHLVYGVVLGGFVGAGLPA
jgi:hypothetical protein